MKFVPSLVHSVENVEAAAKLGRGQRHKGDIWSGTAVLNWWVATQRVGHDAWGFVGSPLLPPFLIYFLFTLLLIFKEHIKWMEQKEEEEEREKKKRKSAGS